MGKISLSDKKVIVTRSGSSIRDPNFRIPDIEVVGQEYDNVPGGDRGENSGPGAGETIADIGVPRDIQIESQTVRTRPDGSDVIDVVLSFEPAEGAVRHELRQSRL